MSISPAPALYRIYRAKNTGQYQLIPLLAMFGNYLLWMIYGFFIHNIFPVVVAMAICSSLGLTYSLVFLYATDHRVMALKTFAVAAVPVSQLITYGVLAGAGVTHQSDASTADVLGDLAVVTTLLFYTSPLVRIRTVAHQISRQHPCGHVLHGLG